MNSSSYNLGTGHGFSVREVIRSAKLVSGRNIPVAEGKRRPGDPARLVAAAKRAKGELGWNPQYGDLRQIIATAWNWTLKRQGVLTQGTQLAETA